MKCVTVVLGSVLALAACDNAESGAQDGSGATVGGGGDSAGGAGAAGGTTGTAGGGSGATGGHGGAGGSVGTPGCGNPPAAGKTAETLWVDGVERSFTVAVPAGLDGLSPVPLIFGFHGFGGTGEAASNYFGLTGDEAAIYVYPQALPLPDQGNGVGWNMTEDGVDVAFVDALIDAMTERHCIDLSRVFAAGHSHGASFSNHLGCYRPERFRAIAPVAGGGPWAGPCSVSGDTVAAMLTHGTNDVDVPIAAGISSRDHWREQNGCANALSMHTTPSPCVVYDGCSEPVLWCEHGGGHEWPNFAGEGIRGFFLSF